MARWEPDARERLVLAAVDLFSERGYDNTTVIEIAERAGLTKSTFFRHFRDKREVLFAGQDILSQLLADGITAAPDSATPLEALVAGLDAATALFTPQRQDFGLRLRAVIADNPELQEREALKRARFASAMTDALQRRGVPEPIASLAAELGVLAFHRGYGRWVEPDNEQTYTELARQALNELRSTAATLD
jgi:AcrR family transcriptional regulator